MEHHTPRLISIGDWMSIEMQSTNLWSSSVLRLEANFYSLCLSLFLFLSLSLSLTPHLSSSYSCLSPSSTSISLFFTQLSWDGSFASVFSLCFLFLWIFRMCFLKYKAQINLNICFSPCTWCSSSARHCFTPGSFVQCAHTAASVWVYISPSSKIYIDLNTSNKQTAQVLCTGKCNNSMVVILLSINNMVYTVDKKNIKIYINLNSGPDPIQGHVRHQSEKQ